MSTAVQLPVPPQDIRLKPARALVGWLTDQDALNRLAIGEPGRLHTSAMRARWQRAQTAVSARAPLNEQMAVVSEPSDAITAHLNLVRQDPGIAQELAQGWKIACVDLRRVRAAQQHVILPVVDQARAGLDGKDLTAVSRITLPPSSAASPINFQVGDQGRSWVVTSRNHNLHVVAPTQMAPPGAPLFFGFGVAQMSSMMRVIQVGNKQVLTDGYHRAVALIRRGIFEVPVLLRNYAPNDLPPLPNGLLPLSIVMGDRPPLLGDYLDEEVSAHVLVEESCRMILISAQEINATSYS